MTTTMSVAITVISMSEAGAIYRLMSWLSPAYPVGAFSYSHGLEYAVEAGLVRDRDSLIAWIGHIVQAGGGWLDAVLFARAYDAALAGDWPKIAEIAERGAAMRGTAELALEASQQARAFVTITCAAWPDTPLSAAAKRPELADMPYSVALALACSGNVSRETSLLAFLQAFSANLVSAGVRLVPLGQTDGQKAQAALAPIVAQAAREAADCPLDELGTSAIMVDWASAKHETQYTRLFRS